MCQEDNLNLQEPPSSGSAVGESKDKVGQESGQDLHSENAETTEVKVLDDMNTPMEVLLQRFKTFESPFRLSFIRGHPNCSIVQLFFLHFKNGVEATMWLCLFPCNLMSLL